jgi:hypothetical protein
MSHEVPLNELLLEYLVTSLWGQASRDPLEILEEIEELLLEETGQNLTGRITVNVNVNITNNGDSTS